MLAQMSLDAGGKCIDEFLNYLDEDDVKDLIKSNKHKFFK